MIKFKSRKYLEKHNFWACEFAFKGVGLPKPYKLKNIKGILKANGLDPCLYYIKKNYEYCHDCRKAVILSQEMGLMERG